MLLNKKLISHVIWILLASILGISMSYLILLGGKYAYGAIYDTTTSQNIIVNTPLPPPERSYKKGKPDKYRICWRHYPRHQRSY